MNSRIRETLMGVDRLIARSKLAMGNEQGVLLSFLFHSLYQDEAEAQSEILDPQQGITIEMFRRFIAHFQKHDYTFVSVADMAAGLRADGKHVLVTFDDGYYNNVRALPILSEFGIPATLFVATSFVKESKSFWWDVVERESLRRRTPLKQVRQFFLDLKKLRTADVEAQIRNQFGANALKPVSDLDRPFTPTELREFAQHPLISLGNHTCDHGILTNYSVAEALAQIQQGQGDIVAMTGKTPEVFAYPNGDESPEIIDVARSAGMRFGVSVNPGRNRLPLLPGSRDAMTLKRFTLTGHVAIEPQCRMSRSGMSLYRSARSMKLRARAEFSSLRPA